MTNLFDVADAIRHNKALIHGLILINRSTVFPVLPVTLQQKTERLLIDHQMIQEDLYDSWTGDPVILKDFLVYLEDQRITLDSTHPTLIFIQNTSSLMHQYMSRSQSFMVVPDDGSDHGDAY